MWIRLLFLIFFSIFHPFAHSEEHYKRYLLCDDPIDVVIVTHPKDKVTLDECIKGIRENCNKVRRVIVVSSERLTNQAEWFDEKQFPFSLEDVAMTIVRYNKEKRETFFSNPRSHALGWYFQQLLKLYAPFVIPDISSNVLILDSDTLFMNRVEFLNDTFGGLLCFNSAQGNPGYFEHAKRLVPGYERIYPEVYSVCHHMLFQKPILEDLFQTVEEYHGTKFWIAFCLCVGTKNKGASEFEIYFNYALRHTDQAELRPLKWTNSGDLSQKQKFKRKGFHFVSFHSYLR
jgi:hypothetical protein